MIDLSGRRALVNGGSRGIGAAIAVALAENGADVVITSNSSSERAAEVVKTIEEKGRRAFSIQADSGDPDAINSAVDEAVEKLGGLDVLVNSAGIGVAGSVVDAKLDDFQKMMDVNVRGPFVFSQAAIPHLTSGGRIVTIGSSFAERVPFGGMTVYAMSKAALTSFTRSLSRELGPQGITVNLVLPGSTDTEMNPADGEYADDQLGFIALGRYADPREIANTVVFLASPAASFVTGAMVSVDGGLNA